MSDSDKPSSSSLWQPVSSDKVTDVTPDPIVSSSTTVASGPAKPVTPPSPSSLPSSSPSSSSSLPPSPPPPREPPSGRTPPSSAAPPPPPRKRGLGGMVGAIVFVVAVLAVLYALAPHWLPALMQRSGINTASAPITPPAPVASGMSEAERQKLETQFADLNARLNALKAPGSDAALAAQVKTLQGQLDQLVKDQNQLADLVSHANQTPSADATKLAATDAALASRVDELQKQLDALSAAVTAGKTLRGDVETLSAELAKATDRNAKLEQRLAELEKTVAAQQNVDQRSISAARASATMALAARLRGNVDAGRPLTDDLAALKPLAAGDADLTAALSALDPLANGSDGITALRQSFQPVARAIVTAGKNDEAGSWVDKAVARLSSIVSVRRVGDVQGDSTEAHVARAEAALNNNRLDLAVAELKPLTGTAAQAAAAWLAKAERQLAAMAAADRLQALAAQRLAAIQQSR